MTRSWEGERGPYKDRSAAGLPKRAGSLPTQLRAQGGCLPQQSFMEKWFKNRSAGSFPCDSALDLRGGRWKGDAGYEQRPEELQTSEIP